MLLTSSSWFSRWRGTSKQPDVQVQEELGRAAVPVNGEEDNSEVALTAAAQGGFFAARGAVEQREWQGKRAGSRMCVVNHCTELRETICMCPEHARALVVMVQGVESRFCQVCKRPQPLSDFIRANRTCTRVLESKRAKRWRKKMQKQRDPGVQSCSASSKLAAAETPPQFAEAAHQVQQRNPFAPEEGVGVSAGFHQLSASSSGALQHALQHAFSRPPPSHQQQPDHTEMNSIWDSAETESDIWDSTGGTESSIWDSAGTESDIWDSTGGVTENNNNIMGRVTENNNNIMWDSNEGSAETTKQRMLNSTRRPINPFAPTDTQRATYGTQAEIQHHNPNTQNLTTGVVQSMAALWSTDSNSSMMSRPMNAFAPADMARIHHNPTHLSGMDHSMAGCPQPPQRWSTTSPEGGREFSPEPMVEPMYAKSSIDYHSVADLEAISVKVQQQKTAYLQQRQQRTAYLQQHVDRAQTANNVPPASWCFDNKALPSAAMSSAAMSRSENATVASSMDAHQHQASNGFVPTPNNSLLRRLAVNDLTW